jgi:hypothetical protein
MSAIHPEQRIGVRWTIGDVSLQGFEALRLSVWGAWKVFGREAEYAICVNSVPIERAQAQTGGLPDAAQWIDATYRLPQWLRLHLDDAMAEGVGWKFAPLRLFPSRYEIALDNDCILWQLPAALRAGSQWGAESCVIAEDVSACFGQFASLLTDEPRNSGIRGTPRCFDLERAIRHTLERQPCLLRSETDEQGLQVAALSSAGPLLVVRTEEVTICSPFPPHTPDLGTCGAHFVGLNARNLPWEYRGRPASETRRAHWREHRLALYERVGIPPL